ncbi:MAG: response regulator [Mariprofundaceae bacterium]
MVSNLAKKSNWDDNACGKKTNGHCQGNILVVDDDGLIREVMHAALTRQGHRVQLGSDLATARKALIGNTFDLIFLDIVYPDQKYSGFDIMNDIRKYQPGAPIVLMTAYPSTESAVEALHKNAFDYLMKPIKLDELKQVTKRALRYKAKLDEARRIRERLDIRHSHNVRLTDREKDILRLFAKGFTFKETAMHLGCKPSTIQSYAKQLYRKLGVHSRSEAVFEAIHLSLIDY